MMRKRIMTALLLLCTLSLVTSLCVPGVFASDTVIFTIDPDDVESATYASPYIVYLNRSVRAFTLNFNASFSYDSSNLTIFAVNNASQMALFYGWAYVGGDLKQTGGSFNFTDETYEYTEGNYVDDGFDPLGNLTFYATASPGLTSGEALFHNGTEVYNAWGWETDTGGALFDEIWLFKTGSGSIYEDPSANFTVTLSSSVYLGYSTTSMFTDMLPDLLELVVAVTLIGGLTKAFRFDF